MRYALLLTFVVALGLTLLGCGSSEDIVAVVDGKELPMSLIDSYIEAQGQSFASAQAEFDFKRMAVDSLIDYELLLQAAYKAGLDRDREINRVIESQRSQFLFDEIYRQDILPQTIASEAEVDEFLEKSKQELRLRHVLVRTEAEADSIYRELQGGADFGMVARAVSLDQSSAVKGGDLGFIGWARPLAEAFRETAFSLEVGEISQPVQTEFGWHIIKNEEVRDAKLPETAETRMFVREAVRKRKELGAQMEFWQDLEGKANVQINQDATDLILEKLRFFYPDTIGGAARPDNFFPNVELLEPFERQTVLATYTGGELTIEDYLMRIGTVQEFYRPSFANHDSLTKVIFQLELNNIVEFEGNERNLEESPEYQERIRMHKEGLMVDRFERNTVTRDIGVDEPEIAEFYNSHLDEFMTEPVFHIQEIEHDSLEFLKELLRQIDNGADFGELAKAHTQRAGMRDLQGDLGMVPSYKYPELYKAARVLDVYGVSPVVENVRGNYSIIRVLDLQPAQVRPLEQCHQEVRQRILTLRRNDASGAWLEQARATSKIVVNEDVLWKSIDESMYEGS